MAVQPDAKIEGFGILCGMRNGYKPQGFYLSPKKILSKTYIQFIKNT